MEIPSSASSSKATLGQGYNVEQERFSGQCVAGNTVFKGAQEAFAIFDKSVSSSSLSESLGFEVGGKARYGAINGSASASFLSQASSNSYSEVTVYSAKVKFKNAKLEAPSVELTENVGKKVKKDGQSFVWEDWETVCGHEFVDQITLGAALYICARIEFSTREQKEEFKAEFNIKGPAFQVSGKLQQASSKFAGKASIVISAYQLGGKVERLNTIFDAITIVDGKEVNPLLVCSFDNPGPCLEIFNKMLQYATDGDDPNAFPQQIKLDVNDIDINSPSGPAELSYLTAPWSDLAFLPPPPLIADLVENSRKELSNLFEENYEIQNRINNLKTLNIRFSPRQSQSIDEAEAKVTNNLSLITPVADICYKNPEQCPISVNNLKGQLKSIEKSELDIFPETFSQWFAIKDLPSTLKSTKVLIDGLVAKFKDKFVNFDAMPEKGIELERFLSTLEELDLSFPLPNQNPALIQVVSELELDCRPIATLSNLIVLVINNQRVLNLDFLKGINKLETLELSNTFATSSIKDISSISSLTNLKRLILGRHLIENINPLVTLSNLEVLGLTSNQIEDISPISRLTNLTRLFLGFNKIKDISALNQLTLEDIDLQGNPIVLSTGQKVSLTTRRSHVFTCLESTGNVSVRVGGVRTDPNISDELFAVTKVGGEGAIKSGDKIMIRTRLGFFFNSLGSTGNVSAIEVANNNPDISDEIFTIVKVGGDGEIKNGDKIMIRTRLGFFFNSLGSTGNVSAIQVASNDPDISDEIFTINIFG